MKKGWVQRLKILWNPQLLTQPLLDEIRADNQRYNVLLDQFQKAIDDKEQYSDLLSSVTSALAALQWFKDSDFRYINANHAYCTKFFGVMSSERCLKSLTGKDDKQVVQEFYPNGEITNTLVDASAAADSFIRLEGKNIEVPGHFFMMGTIDGVQSIIYVMKAPKYTPDGQFKGCTNLGWDLSSKAEAVAPLLNSLEQDGKSHVIMQGKYASCLFVDPDLYKCGILNHVCLEKLREHTHICIDPSACDADIGTTCSRKDSWPYNGKIGA